MDDSASENREPQAVHPSFERFLRRFDSDETVAGEKYESVRRRLVKFFECNRCAGPEDLADEVFDRIVAKPETEIIRDVVCYAIGVARLVSMESHNRMRREVHSEDLPGGQDSLPESHNASTELMERLDNEKRLSCLRTCLAKLDNSDRELAIQYYGAEEEKQKYHRRKVAEKCGLTLDALRVRMNRMRERLEKCVTCCLNFHRQRSNLAR
jgi:DNA-directed RNA polymerase specialized sigma24 family protein